MLKNIFFCGKLSSSLHCDVKNLPEDICLSYYTLKIDKVVNKPLSHAETISVVQCNVNLWIGKNGISGWAYLASQTLALLRNSRISGVLPIWVAWPLHLVIEARNIQSVLYRSLHLTKLNKGTEGNQANQSESSEMCEKRDASSLMRDWTHIYDLLNVTGLFNTLRERRSGCSDLYI